MTERRPLVIISGSFSELPLGDKTPVDAGTLTAGSGLQGGGDLDGTDRRFDIELAAAPSGLILVGTGDSATLGIDGAAQATADTALASGNDALIYASLNEALANVALASGNAALVDSSVALASGNAALVDSSVALASGNAALVDSSVALASGNAALVDLSGKVSKAGDIVSGTLVVDSQSYGVVSSTISSGVILLDFSENNNFDVTLEGNSTLAPSVSPSGGQSGAVYIRQDGTGSRTLSYSGGFSFSNGSAPTLTTTASGVDLLAYYSPESSTIVATLLAAVSGV